jgi:hypothetical protein
MVYVTVPPAPTVASLGPVITSDDGTVIFWVAATDVSGMLFVAVSATVYVPAFAYVCVKVWETLSEPPVPWTTVSSPKSTVISVMVLTRSLQVASAATERPPVPATDTVQTGGSGVDTVTVAVPGVALARPVESVALTDRL